MEYIGALSWHHILHPTCSQEASAEAGHPQPVPGAGQEPGLPPGLLPRHQHLRGGRVGVGGAPCHQVHLLRRQILGVFRQFLGVSDSFQVIIIIW